MRFTINIENKIAIPINAPEIICGNSDYIIDFVFDAEWNDYEIKTARFTYKLNGRSVYKEVPFTGTECKMPVLSNISEVEVGVYSGELTTTTPAKLTCKKSILCSTTTHQEPDEDVYIQLLDLLKNNFPVDIALQAAEEIRKLENVKASIEQLVKEYTQIYLNMKSECVNKSGDTMTGSLMLPAETPLFANEAIQKWYVDATIPQIKFGTYIGTGDNLMWTEWAQIDCGFKPDVIFLFENMEYDLGLKPASICHNGSDTTNQFIMYSSVNKGHVAEGVFTETGFNWHSCGVSWQSRSTQINETTTSLGEGMLWKTAEPTAEDMHNEKNKTYFYLAVRGAELTPNTSFANFDVDISTGDLIMITPDNCRVDGVQINEDGYLEVNG